MLTSAVKDGILKSQGTKEDQKVQQFTSKDTSLKQVCKIYKNREFPTGAKILDYGGGAYDEGVKYMANKGVTVNVYDPYNRSEDHNKKALSVEPDYIICANVLNVIKEDEIIKGILKEIRSYNKPVMFCMYEGNRTGKGTPTKKGYQRNQKTAEYLGIISEYFDITKTSGGIIECL